MTKIFDNLTSDDQLSDNHCTVSEWQMQCHHYWTEMRFDHFCSTGGWRSPCWKFMGVLWNKKCDSEKVSIIWHLQMDTLHAQNLEFIHHELACSRSDQAKVVFWQMQKLKHSISKIKSCMLKKSTVFNFLYIF